MVLFSQVYLQKEGSTVSLPTDDAFWRVIGDAGIVTAVKKFKYRVFRLVP